ncbi:MAG: FecR family protein [Saprospiraceae bacterium]
MEKKYTNYDEIDFAEEPSFILWVQGKDQKATAFWTKWIGNNPNKKEAIKTAKVLVNAIKIKEVEPSETRIKSLWGKIDAATPVEKPQLKQDKQETAVVRSIGRRRWISYAAAACIGLVAFFTFYNPTTTIDVRNGEQLAYTLPDNSKVNLNAASTISFKAGDFDGDRIVNLEGEAFFEVEKGQSFKVITPNGTIEVLGTSFNVNARNGDLEVVCRTGKVKVTAQGSEQILTKGLGTKLNANKSALEEKETVDINKQTSWMSGEFYLEDILFSEIISELERQFDIAITCDAELRSRTVSYSFKKDNLKKALADIDYILGVTHEINGKNISITTK